MIRYLLILSLLFSIGSVQAQTDDRPAQFESSLRKWKQAAKDAIVASRLFALCPLDQADTYREQWANAVNNGRKEFENAMQIASQLIRQRSPGVSPDMLTLLAKALDLNYDAGNYPKATEVCDALLEYSPQGAALLSRRIFLAFSQNDFDACQVYLDRLRGVTTELPPNLQSIAEHLPQLRQRWQQELALRESAEKKGDNPQVRLTCDLAGENEILIELFEDQAPGCVANFIDLVKRGFYDQLSFHQVVAHAEARSGSPAGDGSDGPGYLVASEYQSPQARHLFRGSVAMINMGTDDGVGSQFSISFSPSIDNPAKSTVIGRVLSGMNVVDRLARTHVFDEKTKQLQAIDGQIPNRITHAEVVRDRGHRYEPNKLSPAQ